jgi:cytochrome c oxidase assembly factor CtaG
MYPPRLLGDLLYPALYFFICCGAFYIVKVTGLFNNSSKKYTISFLIFSIILIVKGVGYIFGDYLATITILYNMVIMGLAGMITQFIDSRLDNNKRSTKR